MKRGAGLLLRALEACAPKGGQLRPQAAKPGKRKGSPSAAPDKAEKGAAVPKKAGGRQGPGFLGLEWEEASLLEAEPLEGQRRPADLQAFQEPEGGSGNGE